MNDSEVLIVGAGPVGLMAALNLRRRDIHVKVIDQEPRIAGHTYACALHPDTLKLLDKFGLVGRAMSSGRSLSRLAFYEGNDRRAELNFTDLPVEFPFVLVLSQSALEGLLERELANQNVQVAWNHRVSEVRCEADTIVATIDKLVEPEEGCVLPDGARAVQDRRKEGFPFLVGADGQNSAVRDCLGIKFQTCGEGEAFVVYEFETDVDLPHDVRVVLDDKTSNVMWPLSDNRCRWSFQLSPADVLAETKIRRPLVSKPAEMEKALARHARKLLTERAPWFKGEIDDIDWWIGAYFERRLAERFGRGRCWLAGDAAHRTGPIGVQSMNLGLNEAVEVTNAIATILRDGGSAELLKDYDATQRHQWLRLIKAGALEQFAPINPWTAKHRDRILSCIPASGHQLDSLLSQLGLRLSLGGVPDADALVFQK